MKHPHFKAEIKKGNESRNSSIFSTNSEEKSSQSNNRSYFTLRSLSRARKPFYNDLSFWVLLFSNGITVLYAVMQSWSLGTIMAIYWVQSIIIGGFNVFRILSLKKFSTEGFTINDKPVAPTEETKKFTALFFAAHYGFFHLIYASFILLDGKEFNLHYIFLGGIIFFIDHFFSYRYNKKRDEQKVRNIGRLMFFPYARIIPMHLTILFGSLLPGLFPLVLFLGLKTVADGVMHVVEHEMPRN